MGNRPTNVSRTEYAFRVVLHYQQLRGEGDSTDDMESAIIDLTTDLLHLADEYAVDIDYLRRMSLAHYHAEAAGDR